MLDFNYIKRYTSYDNEVDNVANDPLSPFGPSDPNNEFNVLGLQLTSGDAWLSKIDKIFSEPSNAIATIEFSSHGIFESILKRFFKVI